VWLFQLLVSNLDNDYPEGSAMNSSLQRARQWWAGLDQADRQRVWDARHRYLASDLVESLADAGVPVVSDGRWSCVGIGPTGFTVPMAVQQLLQGLSEGAGDEGPFRSPEDDPTDRSKHPNPR